MKFVANQDDRFLKIHSGSRPVTCDNGQSERDRVGNDTIPTPLPTPNKTSHLSDPIGSSSSTTQQGIPMADSKDASPNLPDPITILTNLTMNINGLTPLKWEYITKMNQYAQVCIIILSEHHLSGLMNPKEIVKSGWEVCSIAGAPHKGNRGNKHRGVVMLST